MRMADSLGDDVAAIMKVRSDYAWTWDSADAPGFAALFADDGVLDLAEFGGVFTGAQEIADRIGPLMTPSDGLPATLHALSSPSIDVDGDRATGRWYAHVFHQPRPGDGPVRWVGRYFDQYRRTPDGWRFQLARLSNYWFVGY